VASELGKYVEQSQHFEHKWSRFKE